MIAWRLGEDACDVGAVEILAVNHGHGRCGLDQVASSGEVMGVDFGNPGCQRGSVRIIGCLEPKARIQEEIARISIKVKQIRIGLAICFCP